MYQFIIILRAIACIFITNSHQEAVYPIRILASGGLLGDVIFFAISGFCLYSLKPQGFGKWYLKRLKRVYPPVWITAGIFMITGIYGSVSMTRFLYLMVYPTHYHFVASILVMYIFYYFFLKLLSRYPNQENRNLKYTVLGVAAIYFILFYTVFDRSYYHIDDVYSPMIWPLYFLAMIIGLYFRIHVDQYLGKGGILPWIATFICAVLYFGTKYTISRGMIPASLQWINQLVLLVLLVCIFRSFIGFERRILNLPSSVTAPFKFIADMAFELYLAQAVIIPTFNTGIDTFPYNFLLVISITFLCAWLVHTATNIILQLIEMLCKKGAAKR